MNLERKTFPDRHFDIFDVNVLFLLITPKEIDMVGRKEHLKVSQMQEFMINYQFVQSLKN